MTNPTKDNVCPHGNQIEFCVPCDLGEAPSSKQCAIWHRANAIEVPDVPEMLDHPGDTVSCFLAISDGFRVGRARWHYPTKSWCHKGNYDGNVLFWSLVPNWDRTSDETSADEGFQARVHDWMAQCFVRPDAMLPAQRSFRFTEEALELAQASGTSREDVMRLVDYVYGRPVGAVDQEIGGVVVTLAGLANSVGLSVEYVGNAELARCVENTAKIRAKDLAKPQRSPLPGSPVEPSEQPPVETGLRAGELSQLRRIDAAARFYVDSVKPGTGLAWENLMNALFDGRPEKAK